MLFGQRSQHHAVPAPFAAQSVVLDTNVVLDWLLFGHPDGQALDAALAGGELRWIATAAMRNEFAHVLAHGAFDRWNQDPAALQAQWDRHCTELPAPLATGPMSRLHCTDPDDQKFIDLAASHSGCLLLSRDRAVLKLARKLEPLGVRVVTPAIWAAGRNAAAESPPC
jgi:predicted nucleic acid-binding protein